MKIRFKYFADERKFEIERVNGDYIILRQCSESDNNILEPEKTHGKMENLKDFNAFYAVCEIVDHKGNRLQTNS